MKKKISTVKQEDFSKLSNGNSVVRNGKGQDGQLFNLPLIRLDLHLGSIVTQTKTVDDVAKTVQLNIV